MDRMEAISAIKEATHGHIISNYAAAPVGSIALIDSLYLDFSERNRVEYSKMYEREYYEKRGGWDKFIEEENAAHIVEILDQLEAQGFKVDSIDFFDEGNAVIFLNVTKPNAKSIEDYYAA